MAKKVTGFIKLQIEAGKANPAPPIGPALGQKGVNIMEFCKAFNARTQKDASVLFVLFFFIFSPAVQTISKEISRITYSLTLVLKI